MDTKVEQKVIYTSVLSLSFPVYLTNDLFWWTDFAVSAPNEDSGRGRVYIHHGSAAGFHQKPVVRKRSRIFIINIINLYIHFYLLYCFRFKLYLKYIFNFIILYIYKILQIILFYFILYYPAWFIIQIWWGILHLQLFSKWLLKQSLFVGFRCWRPRYQIVWLFLGWKHGYGR